MNIRNVKQLFQVILQGSIRKQLINMALINIDSYNPEILWLHLNGLELVKINGTLNQAASNLYEEETINEDFIPFKALWLKKRKEWHFIISLHPFYCFWLFSPFSPIEKIELKWLDWKEKNKC